MRQCKVVADFPVTAWRMSSLHRPLLLAINYRWHPPPKGQAPAGRINEDALKTDMMLGTAKFATFQAEVNAALDALPQLDMEQINITLKEYGSKYYPKESTQTMAPYRSKMVHEIVHSRWQHLAAMRRHSRFGISQLFLFWKHLSKFRALRREANRASREARRMRIDDLLKEAEQYAKAQNLHKLYKIIRQLAPKQPFKKVQIYDKDGQMLSTTQEADAICTHFSAIFRGGQTVEPWPCPEGVALFSYEDLLSTMLCIPMNKATPPHMAPGVTWKAAASGLAGVVHRHLGNLWRGPQIQVLQSWRDGWLALMGKPGKPCRRPGDFRPLCLQDPLGKALLRLIASRVRPFIQEYASPFPQPAYLPQRSTSGALLYIFEQCRSIRGLIQASKMNIHARRAGYTAHKHAGGYILSLDMTGAFDSVPREHIRDSLLEAGIPESDVILILTWLHTSTYHLQHGNIPLKIVTDRGVRQGCVLSPLIWTCYTCYILRRLDESFNLRDVQLYADDFVYCAKRSGHVMNFLLRSKSSRSSCNISGSMASQST